jgi:hypothetical protein
MGIYYSPFIMLDYYALSFFCVTTIGSDTIIFYFCLLNQLVLKRLFAQFSKWLPAGLSKCLWTGLSVVVASGLIYCGIQTRFVVAPGKCKQVTFGLAYEKASWLS